MPPKKLLYVIVIVFITYASSALFARSYNTFSGPGSPEYTNQYRAQSVGEVLANKVNYQVTTNDFNYVHEDINSINFITEKNSHLKPDASIPTLLIPFAWVGEKIGNLFDQDDENRFERALISFKNLFTTKKEYPQQQITPPNLTPKLFQKEHGKIEQRAAMEKSMLEVDLIAYSDEQYDYLTEIHANGYQEAYNRSAPRLEALWKNESNKQFNEEHYTLSQEATSFMERHSLNVHSFEVYYGNAIQQTLHMEIIEILTNSSQIERVFAQYNQTPLYSDLVAEGADLARELNQQGDVISGFRIADYCGWLNEAEYPRLANLVKQTAGMVVGTVEGGANIVKNTYQIFSHPVDSVKSLAYVLGQTSIFLFHGAQEVGPLVFHLSFHGTSDGYEIHPRFAKDLYAIKNFYNQTAQELAQLPPEERARKITAFFTELYFTGKFMGQIAKIKKAATASIIKPGATSLAHKLQLYKYKAISQTYTRIASSIANTQDIIKTTCKNWVKTPAHSYELVIDEGGNCRWIYDINPTYLQGAVTEYANLVPKEKIQGALSKTSMTEIIRSTIKENAIELLPGASEQSLIAASPCHIPLSEEIDYLRSLFDKTREDWRNMGDVEKRFLKIKYEHILDIDFRDGKPQGLHHDYLGYYENNNMLELQNKVVGKHGQYSGRARFNGIGGPDKTFFPQDWTRKQVIENILEAYDNFLAKKIEILAERGGKYRIKSFTNAGMEIEMLIDQSCNLLSAYPTK